MKFRKGIVLLLIALSVTIIFAGCSGGSGGNTENQSTADKGSKEPTLKSANKTVTWPGADFVINLDYEKELEKDQVKATIGGKSAEVESCINNQARIIAPNGIQVGTHSIKATVDGKECKSSISIEVAAPVIKIINTYTTGNRIGIETENIEKDADTIKVYLNNTELPYAYLTDLGSSAGKYSIIADVPAEIKSGEIYVLYGTNKSNSMTFTME